MTASSRSRALAAALAVAVASSAGAAASRIWADGTTEDAQQIAAVLASIPMTDRDMGYANLGERLQQLGMRVESIDAGRFSPDELRIDPSLRASDVDYRFSTTAPTEVVSRLCPILRTFRLIRRGQRWMVQDRTGNFLVNGYGHCRAPRPAG